MTSARNVLDDYERLKDEDYYKKYNKLLDQSGKLLSSHKNLKHEHEQLQEKYKETEKAYKVYEKALIKLYRHFRDNFEEFESVYNDFSNNLKENDKTKGLGKFLDFVQDNVHEYEQDQQQARQKGMDMER